MRSGETSSNGAWLSIVAHMSHTYSGEFQKASYSQGNGNCVEVAHVNDGSFLVRDSKDRTGPLLRFTAAEWSAFVVGVKDGEFDA